MQPKCVPLRTSRWPTALADAVNLTVDPGETTGWALWDADWQLLEAGQTPLWEFIDDVWLASGLHDDCRHPSGPFAGARRIVCEDWAIYPWEAKALSWDKCRTARGIGAIELICRQAELELILQPAKIKETAVAAGAEELYLSPRHPNRHANDAIQHGVYYRLKHGGRRTAG